MIELRGRPVAEAIEAQIRERLDVPARLVALVDPAAADAVAYAVQQERACARAGIAFERYDIGPDTAATIGRLNVDRETTAIFLHEPAPPGLRGLIDPRKDPEHPIPCTARAVVELLDHYAIALDGADVVIVGRSATVGRPLAQLLLERRPGPTVTVCHTGTRDLRDHTARADVVIAAAGRPRLVDTVAVGAVVVDVGTNVVDGSLVGDVDRDAVAPLCDALSPVPGGVGPVTVACLMRTVSEAARGPTP